MKKKFSSLTLGQLGEHRILNELIASKFKVQGNDIIGIGDDCAVLPMSNSGQSFVVTTDPCPIPVVFVIKDPDYYHYGRMTALINISDLSSMGAKPLGLLVSTVMPNEMFAADYERFLDGLLDASKEWSFDVIGGNIKDGAEFSATGSAIGIVPTKKVILRQGAKPGDRVVVVGEMGVFWAAVLDCLSEIKGFKLYQRQILDKALIMPSPKFREGILLAESEGVTACMDSSDGIIACLLEIARINKVDLIINSDLLIPPDVVEIAAKVADIDARKLMLAWGGWELVCTIREKSYLQVADSFAQNNMPISTIGEVRDGSGMVWLSENRSLRLLSDFSTLRFSDKSALTCDVAAYIHFLRDLPLTKD